MILNGLGFLSAPLYMFEQFFSGKATEHLLGPGIEPSHLSDDRLGRVLDKLFEADLTELFVEVASKAAKRFGVPTNSVLTLIPPLFICTVATTRATKDRGSPNRSA